MALFNVRRNLLIAANDLKNLPEQNAFEKEKKKMFVHEYVIAKKEMENGNPYRMQRLMERLQYEAQTNQSAKAARAYLSVANTYRSFSEGARAISKLVRLVFVTLAAISKLKSAVSLAKKAKLEGFLSVAKDWLKKLKINKVPAVSGLVSVAIVILYASFDKDLNMAIRNFFNTISSMLMGYPILSTKQWAEVEEAKKIVAKAKTVAELATHPKRITGTDLEKTILQHGEADLEYKEKAEDRQKYVRMLQRAAVDVVDKIIYRNDAYLMQPKTMEYLKMIHRGHADWTSDNGNFFYKVEDIINKDDYFWRNPKTRKLREMFTNLGDIASYIAMYSSLLG